MKPTSDQRGLALIFEIVLIAIVVAAVAGAVVVHRHRRAKLGAGLPTKSTSGQTVDYDHQAAANLTAGKCEGAGSVSITSPMPVNQLGAVQPYGLMVGGHVTPVDHQYFIGANPQALRDTYDVVAPADGWIVSLQHRGSRYNTPPHTVDVPSSDEYRMVFAHTCSFLTYVDLVTSLSDGVKAQLPHYDPKTQQGFTAIRVHKGEVVGHIGGQTLDFAVWDLAQKPLPFIVRIAYDNAESWKVFTAPTSKYLDPSVKDQVLAKYMRTALPVDGQICYDQDGKLVGTWFKVGTNGYSGGSSQQKSARYWAGHLSFAPNYLDPTRWVISIGNYPRTIPGGASNNPPGANAQQFGIWGNVPAPDTISQANGQVKYELLQQNLQNADGSLWRGGFSRQLQAVNRPPILGVMLVQIVGKHQLKVEVFAGKTAAQVASFDSQAIMYNRGDDAQLPGPSSTAH